MKYIVILYANIVSGFCLSAQPALNKVYGAETANVGYTVIPGQNGYIVQGSGYSAQYNNWDAIKLLLIDSLGALIWENDYGKSSFGYQGGESGGCKKNNDGYIIEGGFYDSITDVESAIIIQVDSQGDTIWTRTFIKGNFTLFNDGVITLNKGFVAVGITTGLGDTTGDVYLVKLDSAGNILWQKTFGGDKEDDGYSIALMPDGGFIIGGLTYSFGPGIISNYLIRTDSIGDTVWTRTYGIVNGENGACVAFPSGDGGYIMSGLWDTIADNGDGGASYIARLDTLGNIKWIIFFNDSISIDQVRKLENGDIVAVGQKDKPPALGSFYGGYISEFDSNGNQLWEKLLLYNGPGIDSSYLQYVSGCFYDFQSTFDRGLALTGIATYVADSTNAYINEIWLVKTDSIGCVDSYCGIEGIEEIDQAILQTSLTIYPNPAQNTVTIEWQPTAVNVVDLIIYDLLGKVVSNQQLDNNGKAEIDVSDLENGLYIVKIFAGNGGMQANSKLVVIK